MRGPDLAHAYAVALGLKKLTHNAPIEITFKIPNTWLASQDNSERAVQILKGMSNPSSWMRCMLDVVTAHRASELYLSLAKEAQAATVVNEVYAR